MKYFSITSKDVKYFFIIFKTEIAQYGQFLQATFGTKIQMCRLTNRSKNVSKYKFCQMQNADKNLNCHSLKTLEVLDETFMGTSIGFTPVCAHG